MGKSRLRLERRGIVVCVLSVWVIERLAIDELRLYACLNKRKRCITPILPH